MNRFVFVSFLVSLVALPAAAQDPTVVAADVYKVALENAAVRVLDIHLAPGAKVPMHSHPDSLAVALTPCKARFTAPDGKSVESELKVGEAIWRDAESHMVENIGGAECHVLNIELKQHAAATP
jgi:quercetin dioxygenase-like cupin family protein